MPLIMITGWPTSGKSTRAQQLYDDFAARLAQRPPDAPAYRLHLVSDDSLAIPRAVYDLDGATAHLPAHTRTANAAEKDARAALTAAVTRVLSPRDLVILDSLAYIKGWRYQLACAAKNARTPSAVLQIGCSEQQARANNEARRQASSSGDDDPRVYSAGNWDNLVFRYEEPNAMARWDRPLFVLTWDDDAATAQRVFADMWDALVGDGRQPKDVRPNQVTQARGARDDGPAGDGLYVLERETQAVVKRIQQACQQDEGAEAVSIPRADPPGNGDDDSDLVVELPPGKHVGLPQLQRLRRAFVSLSRGGIGLEGGSAGASSTTTATRIRESFVGYLNSAFASET